MSYDLTIYSGSELTDLERIELENSIESCIAAYKNSRQEINRLVFESVAAMTEGADYEKELANKKGLKRLIGNITGSNKKLQDKINGSRAAVQYAAQQTLQRLAEQNLLTFDLIAAVNNKLNASMIDVENEFNQVYSVLLKFFHQSRSDIVRLENRLDKLERNVKLLNWQNSIEYQEFNGMEYAELSEVEKIVCLVRDFYEITNGNWSTSDLLLMKTAMNTIGLSPKTLISYSEFISEIADNRRLKEEFLNGQQIVKLPENYLVPLLGMKKQELLIGKELFVVDNVLEMLAENNIQTERSVICSNLIHKYLLQEAKVDINVQVECFELIMELLFNLQEADDAGILKIEDSQTEDENLEDMEDFEAEDREFPDINEDDSWMSDDKKFDDTFTKAIRLFIDEQFDLSLPILQKIVKDDDWRIRSEYEQMTVTLLYEKASDLFFEGKFKESHPMLQFLHEAWYSDHSAYQPRASSLLHWILLDGYPGLKPDKAKASDTVSMFYLGAGYRDIITCKMQSNIAYSNIIKSEVMLSDAERLQDLAECGDTLAKYLMGIYHLNEFSYLGEGIYKRPDYETAVKYFREAADDNFYRAYYSLALRYFRGEGVSQDYYTALDWAKKAMKFPQFNKATKLVADILYANGDYEEAKRYYQLYDPDGDIDMTEQEFHCHDIFEWLGSVKLA